MFGVWFLAALALVWIIVANIQDLKKREIFNWVSFSLIVFALGFRFFYSLFSNDVSFAFFYQGVIGLVAFFIIGNALYYGRVFAAGDAKLMFALGAVIPFSELFMENVESYALFFILFLIGGAVYGLLASAFVAIKNLKKFKKEFSKQFKKYKNIVIGSAFLASVFVVFGFSQFAFIYVGIFIFVAPYFYLAVNSIDKACMVKKVSPSKLTEGDWLYKDVKIGKKKIKAKWEGLDSKEINLIKKNKKDVWVRYGIPYSPSFLLAFLAYVYLELEGMGLKGFSLAFGG